MCGCGCAWVILNKVKNLVISIIVSALTLSDPSTALRCAQDDKHSLRSRVYFYLPASWWGVMGSARVLKIIPASWESVFWGCWRDCHGQSPRNDVAGILLYTRVGAEDGGGSVCLGILLYTRVGRGERCAGVGVRGSF